MFLQTPLQPLPSGIAGPPTSSGSQHKKNGWDHHFGRILFPVFSRVSFNHDSAYFGRVCDLQTILWGLDTNRGVQHIEGFQGAFVTQHGGFPWER